MKNRKYQNRDRGQRQNSARREQRGDGQGKVKISLFGMHAVRESWLNPVRQINNLYITNNALNEFDDILVEACRVGLQRPEPKIVDKSVLDKSLPQGSVHQGIGVNAQNLEDVDLRDIIIANESAVQSVILILDQVTDPHNVGAIIRSACVFGASGIIMQRKHAPELNGVLAKTACGGIEHLPVAYEVNLSRSIETLQESGYFVIGLDERGEQPISALPSYEKIALVLGAEGPGLRRLVREGCDQLVQLPTKGALSSLNVSNAAAVSLYAVTKFD